MLKIALTLLLSIHTLIHVAGFASAYKWGSKETQVPPVFRSAGPWWLLSATLFFAALILYFLGWPWWWVVCTLGIILSQVLVVMNWQSAKWGTIINILLLVPVIIAVAGSLPSSYRNRYKAAVKEELQQYRESGILSPADIRHLPVPVQRYLHYTGSIGKPKVRNFRVQFSGQMKQRPGGEWMDIKAQQYNFFGSDTARLFYISSHMKGLPFDGLHVYREGHASMEIKVASLMTVADARGAEMDQGETVTLFNDMCLLAPATLISPNIKWETIDPLKVKAEFTNGGNTITAFLYFDEQGALVDFHSDDRFESADGKTYNSYRWSTPVKEYTTRGGRKIIRKAEAVWHTEQGPYTYARYTLQEVAYNCREFEFSY